MKNILNTIGYVAIIFVLLSSFVPPANAQGTLDCSQADFMETVKKILFQKLDGEANMPFNTSVENEIRSLPSCSVTDEDIQTLADRLRARRERQDVRQTTANSIVWQGQAIFWFALTLGVASAIFLAIKRKKYGTAILIGGIIFFILANVSFFLSIIRLSRIGIVGPPFGLAIFSSIVLPIIVGLSIVGYIVDFILSLSHRHRSRR